MNIVIMANGVIKNYEKTKKLIKNATYIIACDGGLNHLNEMEIKPDIIIGDLDSVKQDLICTAKLKGIKILEYPPMKDETDLELGIAHGLSQGATSLQIFGALGGRIDHELANLHLLTMEPNIIEICDEETKITLITKTTTLQKGDFKTISLIPLTTDVTGIVTQGLFYPLKGETLKVGTSRGVSNTFTGKTATITVDTGKLLAISYI